MKVLFGPANIVSLPSITAKALRQFGNIETKGIALWTNKYLIYEGEWLVFDSISWKKPFKKIIQAIYKNYKIISLILWADVIHWFWDINGNSILNIHYWLIKILKKPVVVEWLGSDIRVPEIVFKQNPYYKRAWDEGVFSYQFESIERSRAIQRRFKGINAIPLLCPEMTLFLNKDLFPIYEVVYQRTNVNTCETNYPSLDTTEPVLVHTPSAIGAKGTKELRIILENLKQKGLKFEYIEITNLPKQKAAEAVRRADIFLDQFVVGSYGLSTCEALAMGKPVFCYLMPGVKEVLPDDCPIIGSSLDELEDILEVYIKDARLRRETGLKSRIYAEHYHDADTIAKQINAIYSALISKSSEKTIKPVSI